MRLQRRDIDDVRAGVLGDVAFRGGGDDHLILIPGEVEDLRPAGLIQLCEHIIEDHDGLHTARTRDHLEQRHFQRQRHGPHLAVRREFLSGHAVEQYREIVALRADEVHAASHLTLV